MSAPLPRWYRHRCPHENRVEVRNGFSETLRDYCQGCGADFAVAPQTPDFLRWDDALDISTEEERERYE